MKSFLHKLVAAAAVVVMPVVAALGEMPKAEKWDTDRAAHLLRRAAFGGTPALIDEFAKLGVDGAVDKLVDFESIAQTDGAFKAVEGLDRGEFRDRFAGWSEADRREAFERLQRFDRAQIEELRAWWMRRMIKSPRPFEEMMTLFWHGHFTTGHREVKNSSMIARQNELLRASALGNFRTLLVAISQDPAMLRYLDNANNKKNAPNENYARELMELFTLGEGHYSEKDVKEAARALTGWTVRDGEFFNARARHDSGEKTFLGKTGKFSGTDIIDIILEQPAASRHLARKLLVFFVREDPPQELIEQFAEVIRDSEFDLRTAMRTLLKSEAFYAAENRDVLVKSPVELVVGTFRQLEIEPRDLFALVAATRGMGQELFQPPNVKGWDGGVKWLNAATLFARYNFASAVLAGTQSREAARMMSNEDGAARDKRFDRFRQEIIDHKDDYPGLEITASQVESAAQPPFDAAAMIDANHLHASDAVLNHCIKRVLQMKVDLAQRDMFRDLLISGIEHFDADSSVGRERTLALLNAMLCSPEYQVK